MELLEILKDYMEDASMVIVGGQIFFLSLAFVAILYGFGLLDVLARWANARWPLNKQVNDRITLPSEWNFNVNKYPVNPDGDHGFEAHSRPIDWTRIERNVGRK